MHAETLQPARVLVRRGKQAAPVSPCLRDPARQVAGIPCRQRRLELLDTAAMLNQHGAERLAVVEEDVDPDARVRARDPRHVAERAAGRSERIVTLDARRARLVQQDVGQSVREVARHGHDARRPRCLAARQKSTT